MLNYFDVFGAMERNGRFGPENQCNNCIAVGVIKSELTREKSIPSVLLAISEGVAIIGGIGKREHCLCTLYMHIIPNTLYGEDELN